MNESVRKKIGMSTAAVLLGAIVANVVISIYQISHARLPRQYTILLLVLALMSLAIWIIAFKLDRFY